VCGRLGLLFADASSYHRGRRHRQPQPNREDKDDESCREPDASHGIGSKLAHEIDVCHFEDRLHQHLQHHRNGQKENGSPDAAGRVVPPSASNGAADIGP